MNELTIEERAVNNETYQHISRVRELLNQSIVDLLRRGEQHDQSKLSPPEVSTFAEYTPKLADSVYGSEEYKTFLSEMKPALDHHYANNRHHPEHHVAGISGMTLIDLIEMLCDWKAASERHKTGDVSRSIDLNTTRFDLSDQLRTILHNTATAWSQ